LQKLNLKNTKGYKNNNNHNYTGWFRTIPCP